MTILVLHKRLIIAVYGHNLVQQKPAQYVLLDFGLKRIILVLLSQSKDVKSGNKVLQQKLVQLLQMITTLMEQLLRLALQFMHNVPLVVQLQYVLDANQDIFWQMIPFAKLK